jgi:hypothetical protein
MLAVLIRHCSPAQRPRSLSRHDGFMAERLLAFRSGDYSELAGSLATVAIASLGGPLSAAGAALAEVVKLAQARYDAGAPTRDLRRQITAGIRTWAQAERFDPNDIQLGLALATETVARFGLDQDAIAALRFDPEEASTRVLEAAKAGESRWETENHYEVAKRGIRETYRVLIKQLRASEPVLLPAIQALRSNIDELLPGPRLWVAARYAPDLGNAGGPDGT